jgi:hypothetical protein
LRLAQPWVVGQQLELFFNLGNELLGGQRLVARNE